MSMPEHLIILLRSLCNKQEFPVITEFEDSKRCVISMHIVSIIFNKNSIYGRLKLEDMTARMERGV